MRRSIQTLTLATAVLAAAFFYSGCGGGSSTAPEEEQGSIYLFQNEPPGKIYRFAGVVDASGRGVAGKGADGQSPDETHLYWPQDVSFDPAGNIYVIDWNNHRVLNQNSDGTFHTLIGGRFGDAPDGKADQIGLNHPTDVTFDPQGYLILSAWHNSIVKRMNLDTGDIWTICGIDNDVKNRAYHGDEIPADEAYLDLPATCIFDRLGNMYIGDQGSMLVRKIDTQGIIHSIAGIPPTWEWTIQDDESVLVERRHPGYDGDGGPATEAHLNYQFGQGANPSGRLSFDSQENLYIADTDNNAIRRIDHATGIITTYAGMGPDDYGYDPADEGVPATQATLFQPRDLVFDANDNLYIADTQNHCIRKVDTNGIITTIAGTPGVPGDPGLEPVNAHDALFREPYGVEFGPYGNLWIADRTNNIIRVLVLH